jgi:hypothetical protein
MSSNAGFTGFALAAAAGVAGEAGLGAGVCANPRVTVAINKQLRMEIFILLSTCKGNSTAGQNSGDPRHVLFLPFQHTPELINNSLNPVASTDKILDIVLVPKRIYW